VKAHNAIYTDALLSYQGLKHQDFAHEVIDHAERYVDGRVHTSGLENFWSLLKRGLKGTYISAEPFICFATWMSRYFASTIGPPKKIL
jgi:transposase-like protein